MSAGLSVLNKVREDIKWGMDISAKSRKKTEQGSHVIHTQDTQWWQETMKNKIHETNKVILTSMPKK